MKSAVDVVAGVIVNAGRYLICQRPAEKRHGGLWEYPGGKVEAGESFLDALRRELCEELNVHVPAIGKTYYSIHDPASVFVIHFVETLIEGVPVALEHSELAWASVDELLDYDLAHSDRAFSMYLVESIGVGNGLG